ncbi:MULTISPECIES: glucosylglycerol 3-phosphatase [Prochlorococcus]|uniref:Glucosylglycerol-phosphate phosphatase (Salt tolerance protein A) n=1 Tax=Prochlorococcus marinus (strain SARG / CCMP1375 / SS120) TaxID=167539 RepID=Q7VCE4_PROMA|nr:MULTISPECIES: glucosylglycerol 3-phosphatase [Prochlorococcus]AAP99840.1 Glucosylglycerol-phosphate phosphatase (Salt tolerance protein A) [Prochlorococcus marinus subsp. marinus str. CCMP1375]KGG11813.1 putative glucosylglycerolphosphate phosphatasee [Prochlorococcus marinus str. LG]KGG21880.1 putative glucosylglycerolphosphate phosphatasee [Prochlorococcus marinus str. SS2]KGG23689.1 putative glucosylglycerolphosphate phosphatasee [Prochlorococcus marinus str. SS35]KGG35234.1 putative glu
MYSESNYNKCTDILLNSKKLLIVQDIDGVCIPLFKDPLDRKIDKDYVKTVSNLRNEFYVLTCGEHEGKRGVNRIIEKAFDSKGYVGNKGLYLPGLAACGIEFQDNFGNIELLGVEKREIQFINEVPILMKELLAKELREILKSLSEQEIEDQVNIAVCDTRYSPAINLNSLFNIFKHSVLKKIELQKAIHRVMLKIKEIASSRELKDSFYLHISPNLGKENGLELIKYATKYDIGTTDIQFIINGALKEAGLLVLINKYILNKNGYCPFGENFNVREAPKSVKGLITLCKENITYDEMPILVGVGDTVTSNKHNTSGKWLRGGSDRGFLTLIQKLGMEYKKQNKLIFVDSSHGEVYRPSTRDGTLNGITDDNDDLNFDLIMKGGPIEYKAWLKEFATRRKSIKETRESI